MKTRTDRDPQLSEAAADTGELSLDDLESVIGGLSRPFVPDVADARVAGNPDLLTVLSGDLVGE